MNRFLVMLTGFLIAVLGVVLAHGYNETVPAAAGVAVARIEPTQGHQVRGTVTFTEREEGAEIEAKLTGLTPGEHGLHVHEHGDCSAPDAESAGGHFSPNDDPHGAPTDPPPGHHVGDLGNIEAGRDGSATKVLLDSEIALNGENGVVGRAVVVHQTRDDLESQPAGDSGSPVGCGVIVEATG